VRIEAELMGYSVDDASRKDAVDRTPGCERALQQRSVGDRISLRDERLGTPRRA